MEVPKLAFGCGKGLWVVALGCEWWMDTSVALRATTGPGTEIESVLNPSRRGG